MRQLPIPAQWSTQDRPDIVAVLKAGKRYLWDGVQGDPTIKYICLAIRAAMWADSGLSENLVDEVYAAIRGRLDPYGSFTGWLWGNHRIQIDWAVPSSVSMRECQQARHRWLDQLITEFGGTP